MSKVVKFHISAYIANQYSSLFKSLNQKIDALYDHLNNDFLVTTNKVKKYNTIAREKMASGKLNTDLREKVRIAVKSFDSIIIELQYHDIIRQKLEHIYAVESTLSKEFSQIYKSNDTTGNAHFTLVLYDVIKLSYNQMLQVKEDYLMASNKIQRILRQLWADRDISKTLQLFLFNTAENLRNVLEAMDLIIKMHDRLREERRAFEVEISEELRMSILNEVKQTYTMDSEREIFNNTFGIQEELVSDDEIFF
ncbi:hypothetical protein [Pseudochryseolinea flava]|uniref:Uncharacterized protein n=1 Tax=Pseudochryseolinea flava TaxID=2059302 RepID=A0A364Y3D9_9BACT|nr:hypothetical protein [Pseudochryseolinea flava]RAW00529.1 hypothetical protein DQQ10_13090 [Pseudochryseolinea flava]